MNASTFNILREINSILYDLQQIFISTKDEMENGILLSR